MIMSPFESLLSVCDRMDSLTFHPLDSGETSSTPVPVPLHLMQTQFPLETRRRLLSWHSAYMLHNKWQSVYFQWKTLLKMEEYDSCNAVHVRDLREKIASRQTTT